jgi:SAM-dependent methyltransferase
MPSKAHDFINELESFKSFLGKIKNSCTQFDQTNPNNEQQIEYIKQIQASIFSEIDKHFFLAWKLIQAFPKDKVDANKKIYRQELVPFFQTSPYNKRVYEKPLGYPGDYIMMIYLYEDGYEGEGTFGKLIHRYSMQVPTARANHNRKDYFKDHIINRIKSKQNSRIASIASGPAVEILEVFKENLVPSSTKITCLDFEKEAIEYVRKEAQEIEKKRNRNLNISLINANIRDVLKGEKLISLIGEQDLIYSAGLIDYFSDQAAIKIIKHLFKALTPGGTLIIGNVSAEDKHRAYVEFLGDWHVNHRTKKEMESLAMTITSNFKTELEKETGMNIFLILTKDEHN